MPATLRRHVAPVLLVVCLVSGCAQPGAADSGQLAGPPGGAPTGDSAADTGQAPDDTAVRPEPGTAGLCFDGGPGGSADVRPCDDLLYLGDLVPGDLVITEIMKDPAAVADTRGEWFEVYNASGYDVDLDGLRVQGWGADTFTVSGSLLVAAGGHVVFGTNADPATNGGLSVDYAYGSAMVLWNTSYAIRLLAGSTVIDRVYYDDGVTFPDPVGAALQLDPATYDTASNDGGGNWCTATVAYGDGDLGTPGALNTACSLEPITSLGVGDLVITEILQDPTTVPDASGEWFEVYNATGRAVDLDGLRLLGWGYGSHTLSGSLVVDAYGYVVLANHSASYVDYDYGSSLVLWNTSYELQIAVGSRVIDRVRWDDGATFPDPSGASMSLDPTLLDATSNNAGASWCEAYTAFSTGDLGTPGLANDPCPVDDDGDGYLSIEDCDDLDPAVHPGAAEVFGDGVDNDCDGTIDETLVVGDLLAGDLILTEVMQNPAALPDSSGEWFEVYNASGLAVDLDGLTLAGWGGGRHTVSGPLVVEAGGFVVFGDGTDVWVDYSYGGDLVLWNTSYTLGLWAGTRSLDQVHWDDGASFPDPDGASMSLDPGAWDYLDNNDGENWCEADALMASGDYGTPGLDNDPCPVLLTYYADLDGDGYGDPASFVEAEEAPAGYLEDASDCDDGDPSVYPGATEHCDGVDEDCDGTLDEWAVDATTFYRDADADAYGDPAESVECCSIPSGYVTNSADCDDYNAWVHPGAIEYCDGVDEDCDGATDEDAVDTSTWYRDADGDGYGGPTTSTRACSAPTGYITDRSDCDDGDPSVYPGATEHCDGADEDCDGVADEEAVDALTWYLDADGDAFGDPAVFVEACSQPLGYVADASECDDGDATIFPGAPELCSDGFDNDCDWLMDCDDPECSVDPACTGAANLELSLPSMTANAATSYEDYASTCLAGDFTLESWVELPTLSYSEHVSISSVNEGALFTLEHYSSYSWALYCQVYTGPSASHAGWSEYSGFGVYLPRTSFSGWHHLACVFDSTASSIGIYLDGHLYAPNWSRTTSFATSTDLDLRAGHDTGSGYSRGYAMDDLRLSSTVRYSGTFTPPALGASTSADADTCGLWHFQEAAGATAFYDEVDGTVLYGAGGAVTAY